MPSFFEELWQSVFTPGPTPVLMIATNVTFAATLPFLIYMAISNANIHYGFMSLIAGGLWISINWFVKELKVAEAQMEKEKERKEDKENEEPDSRDGLVKVNEPATSPAPIPPVGPVTSVAASSIVQPAEQHGELKARVVPSSARSVTSTEDEWEKVSGDEQASSQ